MKDNHPDTEPLQFKQGQSAVQRALIAQRIDQPDYSQIIAAEAVKHAVAFYLAGGDDWRERAIEDVRNLIRYAYDKKLSPPEA